MKIIIPVHFKKMFEQPRQAFFLLGLPGMVPKVYAKGLWGNELLVILIATLKGHGITEFRVEQDLIGLEFSALNLIFEKVSDHRQRITIKIRLLVMCAHQRKDPVTSTTAKKTVIDAPRHFISRKEVILQQRVERFNQYHVGIEIDAPVIM